MSSAYKWYAMPTLFSIFVSSSIYRLKRAGDKMDPWETGAGFERELLIFISCDR